MMTMMQTTVTALSPPSIGLFLEKQHVSILMHPIGSSPGLVALSNPIGDQSVDSMCILASIALILSEIVFEKNGLKIQMRGKSVNDVVSAECYFSNAGAAAITALVFQLAVPTVS